MKKHLRSNVSIIIEYDMQLSQAYLLLLRLLHNQWIYKCFIIMYSFFTLRFKYFKIY